MGFKFRLQKLLEYRTRLEEEAQRDYMDACGKTAEALRALDAMYLAIDAARENNQVLVSTGSGASHLTTIETFIVGQKLRIVSHRKKIKELKAEEERLQDILIEAAKEKKTLEKLKENRRREYDDEQQRKELREYDDMAVMRHRRGEGPFR